MAASLSRLLCLIGRHQPDASIVWHAGYGFAHCRRCGRAIVRSLLSDWVVPGPGLRIRWPDAADGSVAGTAPPASLAVRARPDIPAGARAAGGAVEGGGGADTEVASAGADASSETVVGSDVLDLADAAVPVIVRGKSVAAPRRVGSTPAATARPPLAAMPQPIDLLGPHFMGDNGAPPGPRDGMAVFEFDDMAAGNATEAANGVAAQRAR